MTITLLIGIIAQYLGMLILGWQVGKYGARNTIFPSKFQEARRGFTFSVVMLAIGGILYSFNAEGIRSLSPIPIIAVPFGVLIISFLGSRLLLTGTWQMFGVDMETLSNINEVRWQFIEERSSKQISESVAILGSILVSHEDWRVRRSAALSFHVCHTSESFRYLLQGLNDQDWRVQYMCINSMGRIGIYLASKNLFEADMANLILNNAKALLTRRDINERVAERANKLIKGLEAFLSGGHKSLRDN